MIINSVVGARRIGLRRTPYLPSACRARLERDGADTQPRAREGADPSSDRGRHHRSTCTIRRRSPQSCTARTPSSISWACCTTAAATRSFQQAHVELARKVVAACRQHGIRRLLHMSALNADAERTERVLRSKGEAENIVRESGLDFTIFRPSVIFGREDRFLNLFAQLQRYLPVVLLGKPGRALPARLRRRRRGRLRRKPETARQLRAHYDLAGPKVYTLRELVEYVGEVTGHRRPVIGLGRGLSYLQALAMELLPGKLMTRDNYHSMKVDSVSASPLPFGIAPTALEAVAPTWLAQRTPRNRYNLFPRPVASLSRENLRGRRRGPRRAARAAGERPRLRGRRRDARRDGRARATVRSARISRSSCIPRRTRSTRSRAPSARPRAAITASSSMPRPT